MRMCAWLFCCGSWGAPLQCTLLLGSAERASATHTAPLPPLKQATMRALLVYLEERYPQVWLFWGVFELVAELWQESVCV